MLADKKSTFSFKTKRLEETKMDFDKRQEAVIDLRGDYLTKKALSDEEEGCEIVDDEFDFEKSSNNELSNIN